MLIGCVLVLAIRCYDRFLSSVHLQAFELAFPDGAAGTNAAVPNTTWGKYPPDTAGVGPMAEFPRFNLSDTLSLAGGGSTSFMTCTSLFWPDFHHFDCLEPGVRGHA